MKTWRGLARPLQARATTAMAAAKMSTTHAAIRASTHNLLRDCHVEVKGRLILMCDSQSGHEWTINRLRISVRLHLAQCKFVFTNMAYYHS